MKDSDEKVKKYFTDFDGCFRARLNRVIPSVTPTDQRLGTSAPYTCRIIAEYERDLLRLLDDGMLLAIKNFRTTGDEETRFTLMELFRFWPEHYGLKGLRDYQYYPLQFEVIDQSVADWETGDTSTMIIQIAAVPINYDLILGPEDVCSYEHGFSYPILGEKAFILNQELIRDMYNREILKILEFEGEKTSADPREDPRVGTLKMFEAIKGDIPLYIDFESLIRYHWGIFSFTGTGKSNLLSNILRRLLIHNKTIKIIIFDISCEYPFLLLDIFADPSVPSRIILENPVQSAKELHDTTVKPKRYEKDSRVLKGFEKVFTVSNVSHIRRVELRIPTFGRFLEDIDRLKEVNIKNPNYVEALSNIAFLTSNYMDAKGYFEEDELDKAFVEELVGVAVSIADEYKIHQMSALYGWFESRKKMLELFQARPSVEDQKGLTSEAIIKLITEEDLRLISISISDPETIKRLVIDSIETTLHQRKKAFKVEPYILFVWDEAQEFVPASQEARGIERRCTEQVERLFRQGRKYGIGGCIATQRIAHLNTSALQQLHTYFVSTMPRPYDRGLISNTFMIDKTLLEKTLEFSPGEWLLNSYIATGMPNVPIFLRADNTEDTLETFLKHL